MKKSTVDLVFISIKTCYQKLGYQQTQPNPPIANTKVSEEIDHLSTTTNVATFDIVSAKNYLKKHETSLE
jgi:hypothetical protein